MHHGIENNSIVNFFAILLQYNSKHRIALFTVLQNNNNILLVFPPETSLSPKLFAQALLSLFLLCFSLYSLSTQSSEISPISEISHSLKLHHHLRNFSPDSPSPISIAEASHSPIHTHPFIDSPTPHPFTDSPSPIH